VQGRLVTGGLTVWAFAVETVVPSVSRRIIVVATVSEAEHGWRLSAVRVSSMGRE